MHRGELQYREILLVRQPADKVHAAQIEAALQFVEHEFAPVRRLLRQAAVADAVAPDDDRARTGRAPRKRCTSAISSPGATAASPNGSTSILAPLRFHVATARPFSITAGRTMPPPGQIFRACAGGTANSRER